MMHVAVYRNTLVVILAGGRGERLHPLTQQRSKPSVPFGGTFRIIDFTLSNCVNSGCRRIYVLTQYKSQSLSDHLTSHWNVLNPALDEFLYVVPPQQLKANLWYEGTADALFQNLVHLRSRAPKQVLVLSGDHIYKMDYSQLLAQHVTTSAHLTVSVMPFRRELSSNFGVVATGEGGRITDFVEKPAEPPPMPGRPDLSLVSMGIYVFRADVLFDQLEADALDPTSSHDFGKDIIPRMVADAGTSVYSHLFSGENGEPPYWRDIGTLDSYYEANMDLVLPVPRLNLYDTDWPIRVRGVPLPPAKTVFTDPGHHGCFRDSLCCGGVIISDGRVYRSILGPHVRMAPGSEVSDSFLFENVQLGRGAVVRRAIVDKGVSIPAHCEIGTDRELDRRRGFMVTPSGLTVVPKGAVIS